MMKSYPREITAVTENEFTFPILKHSLLASSDTHLNRIRFVLQMRNPPVFTVGDSPVIKRVLVEGSLDTSTHASLLDITLKVNQPITNSLYFGQDSTVYPNKFL